MSFNIKSHENSKLLNNKLLNNNDKFNFNDHSNNIINENNENDTNNNICIELQNIKYKTMLLNGNNNNNNILNNPEVDNINNMDNILCAERELNIKEPWSKLDKTSKILKIKNYVNNIIDKDNNHTENEKSILINYLINSIDKKRLHKVKDVIYNIDTGNIENIPDLIFNETTRRFTLKRNDKRQSTTKGLGPKTRKNIKNDKNKLKE